MPAKQTLSTVAKEAWALIPTVSQVLRGTGPISDQTRDKVLQAAQKLRYVPDSRAASLRSGESREIGFVINQLANPFSAESVSGVVDLLEADGDPVSIVDAQHDAKRQSRQLEAFIRHGRGGLLCVPAPDTSDEAFDLLSKQGIPTVTFLRHVRRDPDHVGIRNADATFTATGYLAELGHRHIAFPGGADTSIVRRERVTGYRQALTARGLGPEIIWNSKDNKLAGLEAMLALRRTHPEVTAVVCNGDMVASGGSLALVRSGLRPGKDLSVIGFDDIQDAAVATPSLTTMVVCPQKPGRKLAPSSSGSLPGSGHVPVRGRDLRRARCARDNRHPQTR